MTFQIARFTIQSSFQTTRKPLVTGWRAIPFIYKSKKCRKYIMQKRTKMYKTCTFRAVLYKCSDTFVVVSLGLWIHTSIWCASFLFLTFLLWYFTILCHVFLLFLSFFFIIFHHNSITSFFLNTDIHIGNFLRRTYIHWWPWHIGAW